MKPFYSILPYFPLKSYPVPIDLKQRNVKEQSHSWKERETDGFFPLRKIVPIKRKYPPQIGLRSWNVTFFIDWKLSAGFLFNWNRLLYNFEVFHFFSDHFSLSITVAWIFKWELLTYNKPKISNFEKVSVGTYHFEAFFPQTYCFVRILSKQVLLPWKILSLTNLPLSRKQNSNVQLGPSHSRHGPFLYLLLCLIICFLVFSCPRPILVWISKLLLRAQHCWGAEQSQRLCFSLSKPELFNPQFLQHPPSLSFLHLPVHVKYHSSHSLIALLLFSFSLRGIQGWKQIMRRKKCFIFQIQHLTL